MKKVQWSTQLKEQFILPLRVVFLGLLPTGFSFIYLDSSCGRGLSWIHEESYADTFAFRELLEDDIGKIFQYINYENVFEIDREADHPKEMVSVTFNFGKTVVYTLDALVRYAKGMGYCLDDSYEVIRGPRSPSMDEVTYLQIDWKAYNPDEQYNEPGDVYASLEKLSVEMLTLLGEYYRIQFNYVAKPSNLYFQMFYMDDSLQDSLCTNATGHSPGELKQLGRYLYISGEAILMDTNMKYIPDNVTSLLEKYNLYSNNNYYIVIALDTTYPYEDGYSKTNYEYLSIRIDYITGLVLLGVGLVGCLITLACLLPISGYKTRERGAVRLHSLDKLPLELSAVLFLLALHLTSLLSEKVSYRFLRLVVDNHYWNFAERLPLDALIYLCCLTEAFSLVWCYKAKTFWTNSLLHNLYQWIIHYLTGVSYPFRPTLTFLGYLLVNGVLITVFSYLFTEQNLLSFSLFYLIPAVTVVCFNIWVFLELLKNTVENGKISKALYSISSGDAGYTVDVDVFTGRKRQLAEAINNIGSGLDAALREQIRSGRLKADLITNVPYDIETPPTSIINYIDLIKREKVQDEEIRRYLEVLNQKSQRLKTLTEDLVEASRASSDSLKLEISDVDIVELVWQASGELEERFEIRHLEVICHFPNETIVIEADGRRLWRVLENLYNNAFKYAVMNSRVYIDIFEEDNMVYLTIKNMSGNSLNIRTDGLTERSVRGGVARTTEGSGLGLSITKNLTEPRGETFTLYINGDLFKVQVRFPIKVKA